MTAASAGCPVSTEISGDGQGFGDHPLARLDVESARLTFADQKALMPTGAMDFSSKFEHIMCFVGHSILIFKLFSVYAAGRIVAYACKLFCFYIAKQKLYLQKSYPRYPQAGSLLDVK